METYDLNSIKLHDVCVTPDSKRFVGVGIFLDYKIGSKQDSYQKDKQLIGTFLV